jgi:hypothetical protein
MSAVQPYDAWFYFAAEDVDEVDREYARHIALDDAGFFTKNYPKPGQDLIEKVLVVALENGPTGDGVWFIRDGAPELRPAWMVRKVPQD